MDIDWVAGVILYESTSFCASTPTRLQGVKTYESTGLAARWDYDAFGNQLTDWAGEGISTTELCPIRFSSKHLDAESGWLYYGYRYYAPDMGRWPSRDPLGESSGENLYQMVSNDPLNWVDRVGLEAILAPGPYDSMYESADAAGRKFIKIEYDKVLAAEAAAAEARKNHRRSDGSYQAKEHGGRLCCNGKGKFSYTEMIGLADRIPVFMSPKCATLGAIWSEVGFWHTHPSQGKGSVSNS